MSKEKYKVWCEDQSDEDDAETLEDFSPEYAAEAWVERNHSDLDYPEEIDVCVRDGKGTLTKWTVTVEMYPHFSATEKKGEANAAG